jgi:hypothetical protein
MPTIHFLRRFLPAFLSLTLALLVSITPITAEAGRRHWSRSTLSITGAPTTSVIAGSTYSFTPTVISNVTSLSYSVSNKPSWATFSIATGTLSGTPTPTQTGSYTNVTISVSDGTSSATLAPFGVTVISPTITANTAPIISGTPLSSVSAGNSYSFRPSASDANGDALTFSISGKPSWASFSTATGALTGTPTTAQVGSYSNIVISVSDGKATTSLAAFGVTVSAAAAAASAPGTGSLVLSVAGGGSVTSTGGSPNLSCRSTGGSGCIGTFASGSGVLSAVADSGYTFVGWRSQGAGYSGCANTTPCTLTKPSATEYVTAVFEKNGAVNPLALYSDIASGPNTGGENSDGIYLTVFGKNFGSGQLGVNTKVYVNDVEVKRYMNPGLVPVASHGRADIQQIATQI